MVRYRTTISALAVLCLCACHRRASDDVAGIWMGAFRQTQCESSDQSACQATPQQECVFLDLMVASRVL
jgi:hypothetical protein